MFQGPNHPLVSESSYLDTRAGTGEAPRPQASAELVAEHDATKSRNYERAPCGTLRAAARGCSACRCDVGGFRQ